MGDWSWLRLGIKAVELGNAAEVPEACRNSL